MYLLLVITKSYKIQDFYCNRNNQHSGDFISDSNLFENASNKVTLSTWVYFKKLWPKYSENHQSGMRIQSESAFLN